MSCEIERPSPKVLFQSIQAMFSNNVLGGANIIPESNEWYVTTNDYAMAEQFYSISEQSWKERDPRYCCCDNLIEMAALDGVYPRPASFAQGYIQVTGTANAQLPTTVEATIGGQQYVNAGPVPSNLNSVGVATIHMQALLPGDAGNLPSGATTGQLTTTIPNVNNAVTVYGGQFCGGGAAEECEPFRTRYLERMRYKPFIGLDAVKESLLSWPCVTRVCERAGVCCEPGDVQGYQAGIDCQRPIRLYAMFEKTFSGGAAPRNTVEEIQDWLFGTVQGVGEGEAPWGITGQVYFFQPTYVSITIDGLACSTPGVANEIRLRLAEYVGRNCPSEILQISDLKAIISQLMAGTGNYDVLLQTLDGNAVINSCGDAEPKCDYRIVLDGIQFTNPSKGGVSA